MSRSIVVIISLFYITLYPLTTSMQSLLSFVLLWTQNQCSCPSDDIVPDFPGKHTNTHTHKCARKVEISRHSYISRLSSHSKAVCLGDATFFQILLKDGKAQNSESSNWFKQFSGLQEVWIYPLNRQFLGKATHSTELFNCVKYKAKYLFWTWDI